MSVVSLLATSPAWFIGTSLVLGLVIGSFLNVVIYRLPLMLERQWREQCAEFGATAPATAAPFNLFVPRSSCPSCKGAITALQNIPLISWLALGGRCAHCRAPISIRYPLIEGLTGLLSAAVAWQFGYGWPAAGALILSWFLIALTFIDLDTQLLPDTLTLPLLWGGLCFSLCVAATSGTTSIPVDLRSSVIGAIAGYLSLWSVYHLFRLATGKEGMGYGDFKLLAALGAWMGWQMLPLIILFAAVVGALVGVSLILVRRHDRNVPIPFGPFLAAAGWLMLLFGPHLMGQYLGLFPHLGAP
jgi:leader peptidase (prepilin peptidase) / N-methyltransferase